MFNYVQGSSRVDVYVHKDGGGGDNQPQGAKTGDGGENKEKNYAFSRLLTGGKNLRAVSGHTASAMFNMAKSTVQYAHSFVGDQNGDKSLQEQIDRQTEVREDILGSMFSVGMATAQWGVFGFVLGTVTKGTELALKYSKRQKEYNMKIFKEENGIQYLRARASINLTTGRLR